MPMSGNCHWKKKKKKETAPFFPPANLFLATLEASKQNLINFWSSYRHSAGSSMCSEGDLKFYFIFLKSKQTSKRETHSETKKQT